LKDKEAGLANAVARASKWQMLKSVTTAEKREKAALIEQLRAAGRDVETVAPVIDDYVRTESRIAVLIRKEARLSGKAQDAVTRSLNALQTEKRKLHRRIWKGVTVEDDAADPLALTPDEITEVRRRLEADEAWRARLYRGDRSLTAAELIERYGEPSWSALLDETIAAEVEGALEIARSHERSRTGFVQWPHVRLWLSEHPEWTQSGRRPR
jgi:hypothetical protein